MDMAGKELKISSLDDWYNVSKEDIKQFKGGNSIIANYNYSLTNILKSVYPEHGWLPWKFPLSKITYWSNSENRKLFLDYAAKELNVKELQDWNKIKPEVNKMYKILSLSFHSN